MDLRQLLKLANNYYLFSKFGGVIDDMADRIFYSLTPMLVSSVEAQALNTDREPSKFMMARRHLVPSIKRLCLKVAKECYKEAYDNYMSMTYDNSLDRSDQDYEYLSKTKYEIKRKRLNQLVELFNNHKIDEYLTLLLDIYSENWAASFGGKAWKAITENTLNLHRAITKAEHFYTNQYTEGVSHEEKKDLYRKEREALNEMIVYANVIDGICHNTDSILNNLIRDESNYDYDDAESADFVEKSKNLKKLMDSKELRNWEQVREVVLPLMSYNDKGKFKKMMDGFRDFIDVALPQRGTIPSKTIENNLKLIRMKKELSGSLHGSSAGNSFLTRIGDILEAGQEKPFEETLKSLIEYVNNNPSEYVSNVASIIPREDITPDLIDLAKDQDLKDRLIFNYYSNLKTDQIKPEMILSLNDNYLRSILISKINPSLITEDLIIGVSNIPDMNGAGELVHAMKPPFNASLLRHFVSKEDINSWSYGVESLFVAKKVKIDQINNQLVEEFKSTPKIYNVLSKRLEAKNKNKPDPYEFDYSY